MRFLAVILGLAVGVQAAEPFRIQIVDRENGWPVPLVELQTTHQEKFVTDNLGMVAISDPELQDHEIWLSLKSHGYGLKPDGLGYQGFRCTPEAGKHLRVEIDRQIIAKRLGRLTGAGLYSNSPKPLIPESGIMGCDSVLVAPYHGKLFWLWGDTSMPGYPLGIFDSSAATTPLHPLKKFEAPLALEFDLYRDKNGKPRGVAPMTGDGPTWLSAIVSLPDKSGREHLVATYSKIKNSLSEYEVGLCVWDDPSEQFKPYRVLWKEGDAMPDLIPRGHPVLFKDMLLLGDPFPTFQCPATFEGWSDASSWKKIEPPKAPVSAENGKPVPAHRGSVAWNAYRDRWITIYTQNGGDSSYLGEIWYAEATSPLGPWGPATKVLSHDNYTFYNPLLHAELVPEKAPYILFEGTYTTTFAKNPVPTAKYDYNQIMYRLDLDDPKLKGSEN
ncbi:hypothetical protein JIN85_07080 [Luteolibacter pohnpeiensis]|uniref:DUF4185 domain-containing protein n=2 Tax=Luteolibacter pohnpeiensis TaxID=454153 RepID=A0A934VVH1_9BACT|nr:hypothetical protein [Luteolibacter pohnpeiensis]